MCLGFLDWPYIWALTHKFLWGFLSKLFTSKWIFFPLISSKLWLHVKTSPLWQFANGKKFQKVVYIVSEPVFIFFQDCDPKKKKLLTKETLNTHICFLAQKFKHFLNSYVNFKSCIHPIFSFGEQCAKSFADLLKPH